MTIKLMKHYATDGITKARCWYSRSNLINLGDCVTIYAKDYSDNLAKIFGPSQYENATDITTDYFEKGRVRILPDHPLFASACGRAERRA